VKDSSRSDTAESCFFMVSGSCLFGRSQNRPVRTPTVKGNKTEAEGEARLRSVQLLGRSERRARPPPPSDGALPPRRARRPGSGPRASAVPDRGHGAAAGVRLRHDRGSLYMSDDFRSGCSTAPQLKPGAPFLLNSFRQRDLVASDCLNSAVHPVRTNTALVDVERGEPAANDQIRDEPVRPMHRPLRVSPVA
jgi:hypothetical protein